MTKIFSVSSDTPDPFLEVNLNKGQKIFCESDAMVYMSSSLDLTGRTNGGFMRAIFRNIANGESLFQQEIHAIRGNGNALLAPVTQGGIVLLEVDDSTQYNVADGAFLASTEHVQLTAKTQSITGALFGKTGGFFIGQTSGSGELAVNGFGTLYILDIDTAPNEYEIIDNGHIVAWQINPNYSIGVSTKKDSGLFKNMFNSLISSEGLVFKVSGKGKVVICSRNRGSYLQQLAVELGLNNQKSN